nr:uncharacterized protein CFP56_40197 [Quercus suber]
MESDSEVEAIRQGVAAVNLSKGLKQRIRAHWSNALIIKVYGRSVGFSFLHSKILSLWKPVGKLDCVDLSCDFYLVRYSLKEDHDLVLKKGPWFIGEHFLSVRPWEPNFRPDTADIGSVAVWVRLPKLPIEYYDLEALKEIGNAIGTVLRIDTHTASESRGQYARLCVQVNINKPLIYIILIGRFQQSVVYEGISKLCFSCGRVGHRREACQYTIKPPVVERQEKDEVAEVVERNDQDGSTGMNPVSASDEKSAPGQLEEDGYGPWLVVTRKKQGTKNARKGSGAEFQKIVHNDNNVSDKDQVTSPKMGFSKDGKRKASGLTESIEEKGSPSGLYQEKPTTNQPIKPNRGPKGRIGDSHTKASTPVKHVKGSTVSFSLPLTSATSGTSSRTFLSLLNEPTNGQFTFSSEAQREMGDTSGEQSHRNPRDRDRRNQSHSNPCQCENGEDLAVRDQISRMEECAAAISSANLMRIRPKPTVARKEEYGSQFDLKLIDGDQEHHEANPSTPPHSRAQPPLLLKRTENGSSSAILYSDARDRCFQRDDASDQMELEGGSDVPTSC